MEGPYIPYISIIYYIISILLQIHQLMFISAHNLPPNTRLMDKILSTSHKILDHPNYCSLENILFFTLGLWDGINLHHWKV